MKKILAIVLTAIMLLGLVSVVSAETPTYSFTAPKINAADNMVDIYKVVTLVDGDEYTKYKVVTAGATAPAAGENQTVAKVEENLLRYDITMSELPEGYGITSAEFYLQFDANCLEFAANGQKYGIYSCKLGSVNKEWSCNVTDGNVLRAAVASDNHLTVTNPIFTLFFKVKSGITAGATADMKFITSAEFYLQFDANCLEFAANGQKYGIYSCKLGSVNKEWSCNVTDGNVLRAAVASDNHLTVTNPIFTLFFKVKSGITAGATADMKFITIEDKDEDGNVTNTLKAAVSITDSSEKPVTDFNFTTIDGTVTFGTAASTAAPTAAPTAEPTAEPTAAPTATPAPVDTTYLESAIKYAETFIASNDFKECSSTLQKKWKDALDDAKKVLADANHTQSECDAAAAKIYRLAKTGESTTIFVFIGVAAIAVIALAGVMVVRKRRHN